MAEFRLTRPALDDLIELAEFIARDDFEVAERIVEDLDTAMRGLARQPGMGHSRDDLTDTPGLRFWRVYSFLIVYRLESKPLEVVRILHSGRDVRRELDTE